MFNETVDYSRLSFGFTPMSKTSFRPGETLNESIGKSNQNALAPRVQTKMNTLKAILN